MKQLSMGDRSAKKSKDYIIFIFVVLLVIFVAVGSVFFYEEPIRKFEETRIMMDTFVTITVYTGDQKTATDAINKAFDRMEEVELIASIWDENAQAYQLNLNGEINNPSEELIKIVEVSKFFSQLTDGCFDITVQSLLDLWDYNPNAKTQFWELNSSDQLEAINMTMPLIGSNKIIINQTNSSISFIIDNMSITTGGIAKGFIVDEGLNILRDKGISHALINAGGDLATIGSKPGSYWNVALENPQDITDYITRFKISGKSVATSGNYRRYFNESENVGHILNPKTGYSANECWSVAIISDNCTYSDVLATGVFVMGPNEGLNLINNLDGIECLIIDSNGDIYRSEGLGDFEY